MRERARRPKKHLRPAQPVTDFQYTLEQRQQIVDSLGTLLIFEPETGLRLIEKWAKFFLVRAPTPWRAEVVKGLRRYAKALQNALDEDAALDPYVSMLIDIRITPQLKPFMGGLAIEIPGVEETDDMSPSWERKSTIEDVRLLHQRITAQAKGLAEMTQADIDSTAKSPIAARPQIGGAPRVDDRAVGFCRILASIFKGATGKNPSFTHDAYTGAGSGPFYSFVSSCIRPTGLVDTDASLDALVRDACKRGNWKFG